MNSLLKEYSSRLGKVRHFSDPAIQDAVDSALKYVSKDKPVAVVGHVTNDGWKLSAAARLGDDCTIMAAAIPEHTLAISSIMIQSPTLPRSPPPYSEG